ncbi:MAG: DUF6364 family protein [Bacteroidetes bacterium]|jgi:hypothetical protein|nr:DUF6364 family protein [Bacteroidota bacterium]
MTTKLTITLEAEIIARAKRYAKKSGRSVSDIVESYLAVLTEEEEETEKLSPKLKRLKGAIKLPKDFDEDATLLDAITKKHG